MQGKPTSAGRVTIIHRPLPEEANHSGNVYGGNILRHMDAVGAIAAIRHARAPVVTAAVEYMSFRSPVKPQEFMVFHACVNAVWNTSMEVGIRTEAEDPYTGTRRHVCTCYLTFVGVDDEGKPVPLPPLVTESEEDRRRMADATRRMALSCMEHKHEGSVMSAIRMELCQGVYAVGKLPPQAPLPDCSAFGGAALLSITRTKDELSLVLEESAARALALARPDLEVFYDYACLKVAEYKNIHTVGMLAALTTLIASAQVPVFGISTFSTCYLLVERPLLDKAVERLRHAGHCIAGVPDQDE